MSVNIEEWRAEIGNFYECLQHSVVKLYLGVCVSYYVISF